MRSCWVPAADQAFNDARARYEADPSGPLPPELTLAGTSFSASLQLNPATGAAASDQRAISACLSGRRPRPPPRMPGEAFCRDTVVQDWFMFLTRCHLELLSHGGVWKYADGHLTICAVPCSLSICFGPQGSQGSCR